MADNSYVENQDILQPSDIGDEVLVPIDVARRYNAGSYSDIVRKYLVAKNIFSASGEFTVTPVVTAGSGTADDFNFDYFKMGGKIQLPFLCRSFIVVVGEATTVVQIDLTGTPAEPSANFATGFDYTGSVNTSSYNASGNVVQDIALNTVGGTKKLQIALTTEANVSAVDFTALIGGTISITL